MKNLTSGINLLILAVIGNVEKNLEDKMQHKYNSFTKFLFW